MGNEANTRSFKKNFKSKNSNIQIFGFWGQLKPTRIPQDIRKVNDIITQDTDDFDVLALPWQMYLDFPWLRNDWKRLANPASELIDKPMISR